MITERLQATGSWDLTLRADTPKRVRDLIEPFSMVAVFPTSRLIEGGTDSTLRAAARWMGVVTSPGAQQLTISGSGLALLLGDDEGRSYHIAASILPTAAIETDGYTANQWLDAILQGTYFSRGITTSMAGTMHGSYQYVTPREVLEAATAYWDGEWRIDHRTSTMTLDMSTATAIYGGINFALISPKAQGRGLNKYGSYRGITGALSAAADVQSYASKVALLGSSAAAVVGGASSYCGGTLTVTRVIEANDVPFDAAADTAAAFLARLDGQRNEISISSAEYDVSGKLDVGDGVYIFDPDNGLEDVTASPITYHGEIMRPIYVRCYGQTWPVRSGMGVGLRVDNGASGIAWHDITPYIMPEDGDATIEIGANQRYVSGDDLALRTDLGPRLNWSAWQTTAITWASTGTQPVLGNGSLDCRFRRLGTSLDLTVSLTAGSTTTFGTGNYAFLLPASLGGVGPVGSIQRGVASYWDDSFGGWNYGSCYIDAGFGNLWLTDAASPWNAATYGNPFIFAVNDRMSVSIRAEVA